MSKTSKWTIIAGLIANEVGDMKKDLMTNGMVSKPDLSPEEEAKLKAENEKKEKAMKAYHEERQKKHDRAEYAREKFRENIRQKYGIGRKSAESMEASDMTLQQVKKDYHMNPEEFETFQQKVETDNLQRRASFKKINQKLDDRHRRKEMKKNFQQHTHCITQ